MPDLLPAIPEKRYFAIGEVAELCQVKPHVLRFWEQEFPQLSPAKRRGNRRYYQRNDVLIVRHIRDLLYTRGFTIQGARQQLPMTLSEQQEQQQAASYQQVLAQAVVRLEMIIEDLG